MKKSSFFFRRKRQNGILTSRLWKNSCHSPGMCLCNKCLCTDSNKIELHADIVIRCQRLLPGQAKNSAFTVFLISWNTNGNTANHWSCCLFTMSCCLLTTALSISIYELSLWKGLINTFPYKTSNKNFYYETDHYFHHHCCHHNGFLFVLGCL